MHIIGATRRTAYTTSRMTLMTEAKRDRRLQNYRQIPRGGIAAKIKQNNKRARRALG